MKKYYYAVCGAIMAIAAAVWIYDSAVCMPLAGQIYVVSPWRIVSAFAARPAFWLCFGIILAIAFVNNKASVRFGVFAFGWGPLYLYHTS